MGYPSFRRLASLLALLLALGLCAVSVLRAQDRSATGAGTRHWWDGSDPAPSVGVQTAAATAAPQAAAAGTKIYRLQRDQRGEAKPLIFDADEIATWTEKVGASEYCVFLFRGLVFAQLGMVHARFEQGVAWIDLNRTKLTGKLRLELYAENKVRIDDGSAIHDYPRAILDLTTRGEFRINAHRIPLVRQSRAEDPLVQRGRAEGLGPRLSQASNPTPAPLQRTSFEQERQLLLPPTIHSGTPPVSPNSQPAPPLPRPPVGTPAPASPASRNSQPAPPLPQPLLPTPPIGGAAPPPAVQQRTSNYGPADDSAINRAAGTGQAGSGITTIPPPAQGDPAPANPASLPGQGPQPPLPDAPATGSTTAPDGSVPPSGPTRVAPGTPPLPPPSRATPPPPGKPIQVAPNFVVAPRQGGQPVQAKKLPGLNGESVFIITGGVLLQVRNASHVGMIDMAADRIVIWTQGDTDVLAENIQKPTGHSSNDLEVYLSGNVIVRQAPTINPKGNQRTISADEVYYDVSRSVAIARNGRLELRQPLMNDPVISVAKEIHQTSENTFEIVTSETFSSRLPSDPGLKIYLQDGLIEDNTIPLRNIFGMPVFDRNTGQPVMFRQTLLTGNNSFFEMEKIPFFWMPYVSTTAQQPLGPVQDFNFGFNQLFGAQFGVSLNLYQLLGMQPQPATSWLLNLDYMSYRGPGLGTLYNTTANDFFGIPAKYNNTIRAYGMYDRNYDILGGPRPVNDFRPPAPRGWYLQRLDAEDMPYGFNFMSQISPVSDRNFIEQYYQRPWDLDPNFDTFVYTKQQRDNWTWWAMAMPRLRPWVTMTQDLPRADGWLIGQDFFHFITYTTHVNAEYASLQTSNDPLPQVSVTDVNDSTFRGDWMQEAEVPFSLGPLRLAPYGRWELTYYSRDVLGNSIGRSWEAGGVRASVPFTHLYKNVSSDLWNVNSINHKIVLNANYVSAYSNVPYTYLPQLDRLNTDAANQALRDIKPYQWLFNPNAVFYNHGYSLINSPYYNTPQTMAIRTLLFDRAVDTLNTIEELQLQASQRLQTKRGFPGNQHIVDWMLLDMSASYFPAANRDNFGNPWAFLRYNYLWNVGDRTALTSTGWTDPFPGGVRVWTIGGYFNRPDRTNFYLGFRYIDPLMVRAVTASVTYMFSPKYAATASTTYDFGTGEAFSNSLMFTRMGADLQLSLGVSYNALQSNFNLLFNIVPNLLPANRAFGPMGAGGAGSQGVLNSNF
ncbi:MAG: LPS-assembly protein LptD [Gemmataceae bacterium]